ncbi:MAG: hypothetical protein HY261_00245 [Chloroflexi bacterium]|nr:hypothetical protein [Chloroflexota bacterium]
MQYLPSLRRLAPVAFLLALAASSARAQTIVYDSLSTSYSSIAHVMTGPSLGEADWAIQFVPSAGGDLASIEAPIGRLSGTGVFTLALMDDASGLPGSVLATWTFGFLPGMYGGPPDFGLAGVYGTAVSANTPILVAGTPYWLAGLAAGDGAFGWLAQSAPPGPGEVTQSSNGSTWTTPPPSMKGAIKIAIIAAAAAGGVGGAIALPGKKSTSDGVVPEPGTYAMGAGMVIGGALALRRGRSASRACRA